MKENGPSGLRSKVNARFATLAKATGGRFWYAKISGSPYGRAGLPDYVVVFNGCAGALELKGDGGKTSPAQEHELQKLAAAGAVTAIARTMEDVEQFVIQVGRGPNGLPNTQPDAPEGVALARP